MHRDVIFTMLSKSIMVFSVYAMGSFADTHRDGASSNSSLKSSLSIVCCVQDQALQCTGVEPVHCKVENNN